MIVVRPFAVGLVLSGFAAASVNTPAFAQSTPPVAAASASAAPSTSAASPSASDAASRAAALKAKGDQAMDALRYVDALQAYTEANELAPNPALDYNRGRALQALGAFPEALEEFEKFAAEAPPEVKVQVRGLNVLLSDVRSRVATLRVTCNVAGAQLRLNDKYIGTTPLNHPLHVVAGDAVLEGAEEDYFPVKRAIHLPGNGETYVDLRLESKQVSGVLSVDSSVMGTTVTVDGTPLGKVPLETVLKAGTHKIELDHDGYQSMSTETVLVAGEHKTLNLSLEHVPPVTTKWWFWTGIGAVVAGGTALAIALSSTRGVDSGSIQPGHYTGP